MKTACVAASRATQDSLDRRGEPGSALTKSGVGPDFLSSVIRFRRFVARMERSAIRGGRFAGPSFPDYASLHPGYEEGKKEAERRQTQGTTAASCGCGARPCGARTLDGVPPRLSPKGVGSFRVKLRRPNPLILSFSPNSASKTRVNALMGRRDAASRCDSARRAKGVVRSRHIRPHRPLRVLLSRRRMSSLPI